MSEKEIQERAALEAALGAAGGSKIVRGGYRKYSATSFPPFFNRLCEGINSSELFASCVPSPEEVATLNTKLQSLVTARQANSSHLATLAVDYEVGLLKPVVDRIADFIEEKYPGDATVAAMAQMTFSARNTSSKPRPTKKVTDIKLTLSSSSAHITWKPLPSGNGKLTYSLYYSTDGGETFSLASFTSNSRKGIVFSTKQAVKYTFYLVASNSNGAGPISEYFHCVGQ